MYQICQATEEAWDRWRNSLGERVWRTEARNARYATVFRNDKNVASNREKGLLNEASWQHRRNGRNWMLYGGDSPPLNLNDGCRVSLGAKSERERCKNWGGVTVTRFRSWISRVWTMVANWWTRGIRLRNDIIQIDNSVGIYRNEWISISIYLISTGY